VLAAAIHIAGGPPCPGLETLSPDVLLRTLSRHQLVGHAQRWMVLSSAQREALKPSWRAGTAQALAQATERDRLVKRFRAASVPVLPYKGIVYQEFLTGQPQGRDSQDLDLAVRPLDFRRAIRILLEDGYTPAFGLTPDHLAREVLPSELLFLHEGGMHLDLHQQFFAPHYALDAAEAVLSEVLDADRPALTPVQTVWLAALAAGKDAWSHVRHLADLADGLERLSVPEREALAALADRTHTRRLLDTGFGLCAQHLGRAVDWVAKYAVPPGSDAALRAADDTEPGGRLPDRLKIHLASRRPIDRVRYALRVPFKVAAVDIGPHAGVLPRPVARVVRTLREHGGDLFG
jgi:hypothetical protein